MLTIRIYSAGFILIIILIIFSKSSDTRQQILFNMFTFFLIVIKASSAWFVDSCTISESFTSSAIGGVLLLYPFIRNGIDRL